MRRKEKIKRVSPEDVVPEIHHSSYFKLGCVTEWGPRIIPDYELIYIVAGRFSYSGGEESEKRVLLEGDVLCIPPGVMHVFRCEGHAAYGAIISCIHFELIERASRLSCDYIPDPEPQLVTPTSGDHTIQQLFRNFSVAAARSSIFRDSLLKNIFRELWLRLSECWLGENRNVNIRAREMLAFIESRIPGRVGRREVSKAFHLSPEHVNTIFKSQLGTTPTQVANRARVNLACRLLLEEGLSIKETAEKAGFSDLFYFSKVFKKVMGFSPRHFRRK
ncbi:MAG: helix-turn-helix transcriptional regulator [Victivallales bacterium]|nr:helix-turn-helix transcriptional regulator [Victivallales bacterium]